VNNTIVGDGELQAGTDLGFSPEDLILSEYCNSKSSHNATLPEKNKWEIGEVDGR
jgi:putative redox protein